MKQKKFVWISLTIGSICAFCLASPPGGLPRPPKANAEAEAKLKEAYAAYVQGCYEKAIRLAIDVHQKHGDVEGRWFPSWVSRVVKGPLPDPYKRGEVLGRTIGGPYLFTMMVRSTFPSYLLVRCYNAIGDQKETKRWAKELQKWVYGPDEMMMAVALPYPAGYVKPSAPRSTWRPLPLRFLEEDYFILVPLDEACKVLGLVYRLDISPKTKRVRYAFIGEKGKLLPGLTQARNIKGERDNLAYACFEESGDIWVPFYWLAKQAGIKGWEVRGGKIYVAPVKDRRQ